MTKLEGNGLRRFGDGFFVLTSDALVFAAASVIPYNAIPAVKGAERSFGSNVVETTPEA